jgi:hypothetical protein
MEKYQTYNVNDCDIKGHNQQSEKAICKQQ